MAAASARFEFLLNRFVPFIFCCFLRGQETGKRRSVFQPVSNAITFHIILRLKYPMHTNAMVNEFRAVSEQFQSSSSSISQTVWQFLYHLYLAN